MAEIVISNMEKNKENKVTTEVSVKVIKDDSNKWKADLDDKVIDALLGGFISGMQEINT